jgi:hypothetical protein
MVTGKLSYFVWLVDVEGQPGQAGEQGAAIEGWQQGSRLTIEGEPIIFFSGILLFGEKSASPIDICRTAMGGGESVNLWKSALGSSQGACNRLPTVLTIWNHAM